MPELLYRCPETHREISLGISVDADTFERAEFAYRTIDCPHCRQRHRWSKDEIYLQVPAELDRRLRRKRQQEEIFHPRS